MEVLFQDCGFDSDRRQVFRSGQPVHLSRKAFDLLGILIASQPRVVSKSELLERLWPSTFVVEGNVANLVAEVRHALLDDPHNPQYVRTVHGFGYAFCGTVAADEQPPAPPTLPKIECWLSFGDDKLPLCRGEHLIGRNPRSVVPIDDLTISRHHARIIIQDEVTLVDLGSRNGTYLRGERVKSPATLRDGDRVAVGSLILTFLMPQRPHSRTEHS